MSSTRFGTPANCWLVAAVSVNAGVQVPTVSEPAVALAAGWPVVPAYTAVTAAESRGVTVAFQLPSASTVAVPSEDAAPVVGVLRIVTVPLGTGVRIPPALRVRVPETSTGAAKPTSGALSVAVIAVLGELTTRVPAPALMAVHDVVPPNTPQPPDR